MKKISGILENFGMQDGWSFSQIVRFCSWDSILSNRRAKQSCMDWNHFATEAHGDKLGFFQLAWEIIIKYDAGKFLKKAIQLLMDDGINWLIFKSISK